MFARTPRLLLRPGWIEDAPALARAIGDQGIVRNLTRAPWPYGPDDAQAFLASRAGQSLPHCLIFTRTLGAPRLVGGCGLSADADGAPELGYWIARAYWGLGFATEASRALLQAARAAGITGIGAMHFADNPASGNVLRKLGFRPTGRTGQRHSVARGGMVDCQFFEEGEEARMRPDSAFELYDDAPPLAA
ncbi:GNAT family N-acetyltransferase [Sphingobium sp. AN641]|uniref:GNAT family N-acetyltransferase n=1 Tax=Sphingobium sp. AN641 TaxID=3133443 RepID=UPI0030BE9BBB